MENYFNIIMKIYDDKKKLRYCGDGGLKVSKDIIEGYICDDYIQIIEYPEYYQFYFYYFIAGKRIGFKLSDKDIIEFPGNFVIELEPTDKIIISAFDLDVSPSVKDMSKVQKIKEQLYKTKSLHL